MGWNDVWADGGKEGEGEGWDCWGGWGKFGGGRYEKVRISGYKDGILCEGGHMGKSRWCGGGP